VCHTATIRGVNVLAIVGAHGSAESKPIMGFGAFPLAGSRGRAPGQKAESILAFRRVKEREICPVFIL